MGLIFGLLKRIIRWSLYFAIFFGIIVLIPNLPPYTGFSVIDLEPTQAREGPLAVNGALNNAQKLYKGKLLGPEAFQVFEGEVYTSLATGEIVKLSPGGHVTFVTKIGQPCTGLTQEEKCGRPLDFEIDEKERKLYVADAYYGIWKVDLKTDKKQLLVSPRVEIKGRAPKLFNSIALAKNGDFYWTDSCSFPLQDGSYCALADPSGRLFHYNAAKNQSELLLDDLWFANGVEVSPDGQFVVVAETMRYRLLKHYVDGPNKGKTEVFVAGLPGSPDNVRALADGSGVLVGLYTVFDAAHPLLLRATAALPALRKFLARAATLLELPFHFLKQHFPHYALDAVTYHIGNFASLSGTLPPMSGLVHLDWNGNIVASYYNTDRSLSAISDAIVFKDQLYIGAPNTHDFVGAVPAPESLKKAFTAPIKAAPETRPVEKKEVPKPVETKPKPEPVKEVKKEQPKEVKKEAPKPVAQEPKPTPKPTPPPPKATEAPTTTTPKPTEKPKVAKVEEAKPKPQKPAPAEAKPTTSPPKQASAEKTTTPPPKPTEPVPKSETKPVKPSQEKPKKAAEPKMKDAPQPAEKKLPEAIPIKEDIPSDTAKPTKETLKVIKKGGPTEIPHPEL